MTNRLVQRYQAAEGTIKKHKNKFQILANAEEDSIYWHEANRALLEILRHTERALDFRYIAAHEISLRKLNRPLDTDQWATRSSHAAAVQSLDTLFVDVFCLLKERDAGMLVGEVQDRRYAWVQQAEAELFRRYSVSSVVV